jgi:hypothetical protein
MREMSHAEADCAATVSITTAPPSVNTAIATGLTTGYFIFDFCNLIISREKLKRAMKADFYVMLVHHILSVLIWPWAVMNSMYAWWINYFLVTEVTNIGLNLRWLLQRGNLASDGTVTILSVVWAFAFMVVRILPIPHLFYYYVLTVVPGCGLDSAAVHAVAVVCIPIPILLNSYWFKLIVGMAMKKLYPKPKKAA